jgi:hypothetical protein
VAGGSDMRDTLTCSAMMGTSRPFPVGEYRVTVSLGSLDSSAEMRASITDGGDTALGAFSFEVVADGGVSFKLAVAGASGNNCDPETMNDGGGIDDMVIELWDGSKTACIASTFTVGSDDYVSDCTGTPHFRCIEKDELVTIVGLVPADYYIRISGYEGTAVCYPFDALVTAPAGGTVNDVGTLTLTLMDPAPGDSPHGSRPRRQRAPLRGSLIVDRPAAPGARARRP